MDKEYLLHKWLNKTATKEEIEELKNSPTYAAYIKIAETTSGLEVPSFKADENLRKINSKIKGGGMVKKLNPLATFLKIAAVLVVLLAGYLYVASWDTSVKTEIAQKQTLTLPDDSQVVLNANSTINYNKNNWDKNRELTLSGEAYFKVTKGKTFKVKTAEGTVTVLGTQFDVFAREGIFNVKCYEGLVSVAFNDTLIKLPAGSAISIENGILLTKTETQTTFPNWSQNESSFTNARLTSVLQELERQYPITITLQYKKDDIRFTGSFTHKNLDLALKSICDPLHLMYKKSDKGEIIIYAKTSK